MTGPAARDVAAAAAAVVVGIVAAALAVLLLNLPGDTSPGWAPHGYRPCEFEDSAGPCYWDGAEAGNGAGASFYVIPAGDPAENDDDEIVYVGR